MRKRVYIALTVLLVALAGVIAWQVLHPQEREPVYQRKPLRVWLSEYHEHFSTGMEEGVKARELAKNALLKIGTNAIPTLLKMVAQKDSFVVNKLVALWEGRSIREVPYLPAWVRFPHWYSNQAEFQNEEAALGFELLGADAQQAVPALLGIYERGISPESQGATCRALSAIGPGALRLGIPSFLGRATNSDAAVRSIAVEALAGVDAQPREVVPALVKALSDTAPIIRVYAARGLGRWGTNAQDAVPTLVLFLRDPLPHLRFAATNALKAIDPEAAAKAGVK
jgi:HEAT repeat protein